MKPTRQKGEAPDLSAIHNRIFFRLFQAGNTLQRQAANQLGISSVQWAVMGALVRPRVANGMTVTELADYLVVSRQNLDGVLTRLERDRHVRRIPDDIDKRTRRVQLTEEGWRFWRELEERIADFYSQATLGFSFDDQITLAHFMTRLLNELRSVDLDGEKGSVRKSPSRKSGRASR